GMARRYGGTGLGTTIARGLTEAMGGRIGVESRQQQGSCFWIEVPFDAPRAPVRTLAVAQRPLDRGPGHGNVISFADPFLRHRARVRPMHVLAADDYEANRTVLQRLLRKAGHRATVVDGGERALE